MKDSYKADMINKMIDGMKNDPFYLARLYGDDTKKINLDEGALRLLLGYYSEDADNPYPVVYKPEDGDGPIYGPDGSEIQTLEDLDHANFPGEIKIFEHRNNGCYWEVEEDEAGDYLERRVIEIRSSADGMSHEVYVESDEN